MYFSKISENQKCFFLLSDEVYLKVALQYYREKLFGLAVNSDGLQNQYWALG